MVEFLNGNVISFGFWSALSCTVRTYTTLRVGNDKEKSACKLLNFRCLAFCLLLIRLPSFRFSCRLYKCEIIRRNVSISVANVIFGLTIRSNHCIGDGEHRTLDGRLHSQQNPVCVHSLHGINKITILHNIPCIFARKFVRSQFGRANAAAAEVSAVVRMSFK